MSNVDAMRERLQRLKAKRDQTRIVFRAIAGEIEQLINPLLADPEGMQVSRAAQHMDNLVLSQAELLRLQSQIWDLEEAIGYGK